MGSEAIVFQLQAFMDSLTNQRHAISIRLQSCQDFKRGRANARKIDPGQMAQLRMIS
jgi:hypothetical protein